MAAYRFGRDRRAIQFLGRSDLFESRPDSLVGIWQPAHMRKPCEVLADRAALRFPGIYAGFAECRRRAVEWCGKNGKLWMVSTRPLLRLGFLLLAAGGRVGTCSSQTLRLDGSGGGLVPLLERNAYGPAGPNALIGETARGPVFQPSTAQDHLATHFVQLSKGFLRRATVALRVDGLPPDWPLTIQIQNQAYEVI